MNKTNVVFQPLGGDVIEPTSLEKYAGVKAVAMSEGDSANDMLLKPSLPGQSAVTDKPLGWLASAGKRLMTLLERVEYRHAVVEKALADFVVKAKEPPAKFQPQELCGRRITGETQLKLLEILVNNPLVTRRELDNFLGVLNSPDVVMRMVRKYGWQIGKIDYWSRKDGESRKRHYHHYMLTSIDYDIAKAMLQTAANRSQSLGGAMA